MEGLFCPNVHVLLVSVSQPAPVPAGHKMIATAMEIGLVRDVVERAIVLHDAAIAKDNIFGKAYNFCFKSVWNTCLVADSVVKTTETIYENTFPCCELCCL